METIKAKDKSKGKQNESPETDNQTENKKTQVENNTEGVLPKESKVLSPDDSPDGPPKKDQYDIMLEKLTKIRENNAKIRSQLSGEEEEKASVENKEDNKNERKEDKKQEVLVENKEEIKEEEDKIKEEEIKEEEDKIKEEDNKRDSLDDDDIKVLDDIIEKTSKKLSMDSIHTKNNLEDVVDKDKKILEEAATKKAEKFVKLEEVATSSSAEVGASSKGWKEEYNKMVKYEEEVSPFYRPKSEACKRFNEFVHLQFLPSVEKMAEKTGITLEKTEEMNNTFNSITKRLDEFILNVTISKWTKRIGMCMALIAMGYSIYTKGALPTFLSFLGLGSSAGSNSTHSTTNSTTNSTTTSTNNYYYYETPPVSPYKDTKIPETGGDNDLGKVMQKIADSLGVPKEYVTLGGFLLLALRFFKKK